MQIIELSELNKQDYNRFVISHNGSFLQSWEWGQWQEQLGRKVYRFKVEAENGEQVAAMQLIQMPIGAGTYYLYAPYGPVGDTNFQFSISNFQFFKEHLQKRFFKAVFLRIEPQDIATIQNLQSKIKKSTNIQPPVTLIVDLKKSEPELLAGMHPKTRYNIKVAQRHGIAIESELATTPWHGLYIKEVVSLIEDTQHRQKYRGHSGLYYHQLLDYFALHSADGDLQVHIYKAFYYKELLVAGIMVDFGLTRMYLYGGSSDKHKNLMAPYVLHWQTILDAQSLGLGLYDLGGSEAASKGEQGFTRFKQGFGGSLVKYAGTYDIPFNQFEYKLYAIMRTVNRAFKK